MRDYSRFDKFLDSLRGEIYAEPPSEPAISVTAMMVNHLKQNGVLKAGMDVLDIGCGQGVALAHFRDAGARAIGITIGADYEVCKAAGYEVVEADQSFLEFPDQSFDLLWCRHVLEHSPFPLFTLSEYFRLTRVGGHVYVEVPAPDTSAYHHENLNHYSVFGLSSWQSLMRRTGFTIADATAINVTVACGPDLYWGILLRRDQ